MFRFTEKKHKGSTLVEIIMVMSLIILIGFSSFTMIELGGENQKNITEEKDAQTEARTAVSYLNVRLRQNDESGKIAIKKNEKTGKNALVIRERYYDASYDTWIYYYNGQLVECYADAGQQPDHRLNLSIVDIDDFNIEFDSDTNTITCSIAYIYKEEENIITAIVGLRNTGAVIVDTE